MTFAPVANWGSTDAGFQLAGDPAIERRPADGRLWDYAADHLGFYGFLRVANTRILRRVGVGLLDLPDRLWRDDYNEKLHPGEAADQAIADAAAEMGCEL